MRWLATCVLGGMAVVSTTWALNVPPVNAKADLVLGQPDFSANETGAPTASTLNEPSAVVVDPVTGKVFVADTDHNRVLRYADRRSLVSGAAAEAVIGQPNFTANVFVSVNATLTNSPCGLWLDGAGRLWVSDTDNNRVLRFDNAATAPERAGAALVLGQGNATTNTPTASPTGMNSPFGLCVDSAGRLWVADTGNNRVLRFDNAGSKTTGAAADGVLGQGNFTSNTAGSGNQQFSNPVAVAVDGKGALWVADRGNNRVFGFPSAGTVSNGTNAALVIGQSDFNVTGPGTSANRVNAPSGVFVDAQQNLWVLDQGNHRALRFANAPSLQNGALAAAAVGQADFTSNGAGAGPRALNSPFLGIFVDAARAVWLSDLNNHRVLRFPAEDDEAPTISINGKARLTTKRPQVVLRGAAADDVQVAEVVLKNAGARPVRAAGTTTWRKGFTLKRGPNRIIAFARDTSARTSVRRTVTITRK